MADPKDPNGENTPVRAAERPRGEGNWDDPATEVGPSPSTSPSGGPPPLPRAAPPHGAAKPGGTHSGPPPMPLAAGGFASGMPRAQPQSGNPPRANPSVPPPMRARTETGVSSVGNAPLPPPRSPTHTGQSVVLSSSTPSSGVPPALMPPPVSTPTKKGLPTAQPPPSAPPPKAGAPAGRPIATPLPSGRVPTPRKGEPAPRVSPLKPRGEPRPPPMETPPPAAELKMRADRLASSDPVGAARALVELGLFEERVNHDRKAARKCYESARTLTRSLQPAVTRLRRLLEGKSEIATAVTIVDDELSVADEDSLKADLLAEKARLLEALGKTVEARKAFGEALGLVPLHAASLRGLEALLRKDLTRAGMPAINQTGAGLRALAASGKADLTPASLLAAHLERMAEAAAPGPKQMDADARLAAWLHVERAEVLDKMLRQADQALVALQRAVAFDPSPGPVRDALTRHLVNHKVTNRLAESLVVEADHERDDDRASRLLYTAARLLIDKLQSATDATGVLHRAVARAPQGTSTMRRSLGELVRLLEANGELPAAADVRQKQLSLLRDPEAIVHEHVRLSEIFDTIGAADRSAEHARQALAHDPEDTATRERLDRALQRLGRHEERVASWVAEGNAKRPAQQRVSAFLQAADIANRHLKSKDEAIAYLRAGWVIDPGNSEVFDALSALLSPPPRDLETDKRGVRARIDLYTQAINATVEPARKVGLLEKLLSIWEDELVQPARALEVLEQILEIEPARRTAILALQRNAERAGDAKRLARALSGEAALTTDPALQRRLLLRAAEILTDRIGDRDRAFVLVDRALAIDPTDQSALRARWRLHDKAGRYDEARKALLSLIQRDPHSAAAFNLWVEVAVLDEHRLKRPHDAVRAYQEAARIKPRHPLPKIEIARLLRAIGDWAKLVEALMALAADTTDPSDYARLLFQAAEVQELLLENDDAALKSLGQADELIVNVADDPALLEAMERIHVRRASAAELAPLYTRWLERHPPAGVDHGLRIALAGVLAESEPKQAVELLEALIGVVPGHVPALRMLERLHRSMDGYAPLANVLRAEADVFSSALARAAALWELAAMEEQVGAGATLEALERIVRDAPRDTAALDSIVRIASKLVEGVGIPHPAALATRARLVAAIQARKELAREPVSRAVYQLEEALLAENYAGDDVTGLRAALAGYRTALSHWPESLLAARGLDRLAQRLGDRVSMNVAQRALAKLVESPVLRAYHLVRAAELTGDDASMGAFTALELYEEALRADPDNSAAAKALARMLSGDTGRLADRLGEALGRARATDQIVLLGTAIGRAALRPAPAGAGPEVGIGIDAMNRVLAELPDDVSGLMLMSSLLREQQLWSEAVSALNRVVEIASAAEQRIAAYFELATIYEGPLDDGAAAERALQAVLAIDSKNRHALERLYQVAAARGDRSLAITVLGRLADGENDPAARAEYDLRLAEACREANDKPGMIRALCDAVVSAPNDQRAWKLLGSLQRSDTLEGATTYAKSLQQVLDIASARRLPYDHRWLTTLGLLESTVLRRPMEGLAHLQQAVALPGAPPETRVALGRGLEAVGRNAEAVQVLRDVLAVDADTINRLVDVSAALTALESALAKDGRAEERLAVEEVRACLGEIKGERVGRLRARRLPPDVPFPMALAGSEIARLLVAEARSPMIDVSVALAPIAAKALRFELANLGISSRDRVGARDGHPTRLLADKLARTLGVESFELYLSPTWQGAARVYPGDPPAIVGPASFAELPEPEQCFALARLVTRIALGLTWLDELTVEAVDGLLLAAVRMIDPNFGAGEITPPREAHVQGFLSPVAKAFGRRQRKLLEEIAPTVSASYDARAFTIGVRRSEYRAAYVLSGDLVSAVDYLRRFDREISRSTDEPRVLLAHPVTNELIRFALTAEAYTERRRLGTVWMGG